jgi:hypothetical protein
VSRPPYILRDPVSREDAASYLKHKLRILDARLRLMSLTSQQINLYHGEYSALHNALRALCGQDFVPERA